VIDRTDALDAEALDAADDLAGFRDRFVVPDPSLIYFDGNSLGRLPIATLDRLRRVAEEEWGDRLIRSWEERWIDLSVRIGDMIGIGLLGARPGETLVADSTTVNLYKLCVAALDTRPGRGVVVANRDTFPTDRYVIEGIVGSRGGTIRWIDPDPVDGPQVADVEAVLDDDVALVLLDHVHYRSAAIADLAGITAATHGAGALMLWDVCHSAGAVPVDLTGAGVDLAVGCSYKYLNGGPGAPSFLFVRSDLQDQIRQPIWGWWGRRDMFEMEQGYEPLGDIRANLSGTPPVLSLAAIEDGVRMLLDAGIDRIRAKSVALTGYALVLFDTTLAPLGFSLASPRPPERRGSHVTVVREDARGLCASMMDRGVVPDFRQPNGIRLGMAPLTTSFRDVRDGIAVLAEVAGAAGQDPAALA
jgi:kynureninase